MSGYGAQEYKAFISVRGDPNRIQKLKKYLNRHGFKTRRAPPGACKGMLTQQEVISALKKGLREKSKEKITMDLKEDRYPQPQYQPQPRAITYSRGYRPYRRKYYRTPYGGVPRPPTKKPNIPPAPGSRENPIDVDALPDRLPPRSVPDDDSEETISA